MRIRRARKAAGLSHDQLSERCGVHRPNLIDIEKGRVRSPRTDTRRRIAVGLGLPEDYFVEDDEEDEQLMRDLYAVVRRIATQERVA